jgi:hypothetical protein
MELPTAWKEKLFHLPLTRRTIQNLKDQGHTLEEAETGGVLVALLDIVVIIILFNTVLLGLTHAFFQSAVFMMKENPFQALLVGALLTLFLLAVWFRAMGKTAKDQKKQEMKKFREGERLQEKIALVRRGAMGNFKEAFEAVLKEKRSDLQVQSVHVVDTNPHVRFFARKKSSNGENVDKNYILFRENLFDDMREVLGTAFEVAPNAPIVTVDALLNFINRRAQYYDGPVLSVRAKRETWQSLDFTQTDSFQLLSALEVRYNDGSEVEPHPELESRHHKIIERLHAEGPKLDLQYKKPEAVEAEDWRPAADPADLFVTELSNRNDPENLSIADFENVIVKMLRRHGFDVPKARTAPGNQLEFLAYHSHPLLGGSCLVWARQYSPTARVPLEMVETLARHVRDESRQRGIFLSTGSFTEEAEFRSRKLCLSIADRKKFLEWARWNADPAVRVDGYGAINRIPLDPSVDLSQISVPNLQELMAALLGNLGFTVSRQNRLQGGAVKALVEHNHPILGGKAVALSRSYPEKQSVGEEAIREFRQIMEAEFCTRGFLFLSAYVTPGARTLALTSGITLVERNDWYNLLEVFKAPSR